MSFGCKKEGVQNFVSVNECDGFSFTVPSFGWAINAAEYSDVVGINGHFPKSENINF